MIRVYIEKKDAPPLTPSLVFWPNYRYPFKKNKPFMADIMEAYQKSFFTVTSSVAEADFLAIPYDYFDTLRYAPNYLKHVYRLAEETKKKVLLFDYTDYVDTNIHIPSNAVLFRVSAYRHHKRHNEIIMPYFVEDLGTRYSIAPKEKGTPLLVGYCGQARFGSTTKKWKAMIKRLLYALILQVRCDKNPRTHMRGIFWRIAAILSLRKGNIKTHIIERSFYSLHLSGVTLDPRDIRKTYVDNLRECDLALSVRGDANASQRFYEALSASRIPLLLDTDSVLPLEELIAYDDFILRVPSHDVERISEYVRAWDIAHSSGKFLEKESCAREVYGNYLRLDRYFEIVFNQVSSPYKHILFAHDH